MSKIAIVTDSSVSPTEELAEKYQVEVVPVNILFEGKVYRDWVDLTPTQAYQFLEKNPKEFSTSAPPPDGFLSAYRRIAERGTEEILCLTIPAQLSATYNSARMASNLAKTEFPQLRIEVIDSGTVGAGETLLILAAARAIETGKSLDEVIQLIDSFKKKVRVFFLLETIRYIYRSGRVPEVASKLGALLSIKPILTIHEGKFHFVEATISKQKGVEKLLRILRENLDQNLPEIGIMHADCLKEAEELKEKIIQQFSSAKIFISEFSPVMGYAFGRGTLLTAFYFKD